MADFFAAQINRFAPVVLWLAQERVRLFPELAQQAQTMVDGVPDPEWAYALLSVRKGADYHGSAEKYGLEPGETVDARERNRAYRQAILRAAQQLGFVAQAPGTASSELDRLIGILDSDMPPIDSTVGAAIVNGAGGASNLKRVRDVARNIGAGVFSTSRLILTGGERPVPDAEQERVPQGFQRGATEIELLCRAAEDLLDTTFDPTPQTCGVSYGDGLVARYWRGSGSIGDVPIDVVAIEAPFDPERVARDSRTKLPRVNTEEVFLAAAPFITETEGGVVVESHDAWTPWQHLIGKQVFELGLGRAVHPAGPMNADRVLDGPNGSFEIDRAEDVVDEIAKTYRQLFVTRDMFNDRRPTRETRGSQ